MKTLLTHQSAIDSTHPEEQASGSSQETLAFAADALAMKLVGERHEKRALVDLVRWLIMRKPEGLIDVEVKRPLSIGTVITYNGIMATVVRDYGEKWIGVKVDGVEEEQQWLWTINGFICKVVSLPGAP